MIHTGDCLDVMATLDAESIDAIVTDPPYGLEFMGKEWDRLDAGLPQEAVWKGRRGQGASAIDTRPAEETFKQGVARVNYGGGQHGFKRCQKCGKRAFSGSPCRCDEPEWVVEYRQEAPSSAIRMQRWHHQWAEAAYRVAKPSAYLLAFGGTRTVHRLAAAIEDAGWVIRDMLVWGYASGFPKSKASLKPAWEPIVMARKPGPLRMLNIDECRIPTDGERVGGGANGTSGFVQGYQRGDGFAESGVGRWPANIVLTDPIFDGGIEGVVGGGWQESTSAVGAWAPRGAFPIDNPDPTVYGDSGTYSRFFLIPKADRSDREPVLGGLPEQLREGKYGSVQDARPHTPEGYVYDRKPRANVHPTVKPVDLMRHLVRLVTPPGGTVLDPFLGSGTTGVACEMEGFPWIGIEKEPEYVAIAEARLLGIPRGLGLDVA